DVRRRRRLRRRRLDPRRQALGDRGVRRAGRRRRADGAEHSDPGGQGHVRVAVHRAHARRRGAAEHPARQGDPRQVTAPANLTKETSMRYKCLLALIGVAALVWLAGDDAYGQRGGRGGGVARGGGARVSGAAVGPYGGGGAATRSRGTVVGPAG